MSAPRTNLAPSPAEDRARTALEGLRGKEYSEEEWAGVRRNLQAFAVLVLRWREQPTNQDEAFVSLAIPRASK